MCKICKCPIFVTPPPLQIRYWYSAKLDTRVLESLPRLQNVFEHDLFKRLVTLHLNMATRLVFAGRWTEKRHHSEQSLLCGYTGKSIFSGYIPTMQFVEKLHNSTLKARVLYKSFFFFNSSNCLLGIRVRIDCRRGTIKIPPGSNVTVTKQRL